MTQIITHNTETDEVIGIYDVEIKHLRNPIVDIGKNEDENWQSRSDAWLVVINGQCFDYFTGIGQRAINPLSEIVRKNYMRKDWSYQSLSVTLKATKPVTPKFDSILACLVQDAVGSSQTFDDWCSDYGYDTDSRKALEIYMACQEIAKKLRLARVPVEAEAERLQDY
jgi:hypothetical protein